MNNIEYRLGNALVSKAEDGFSIRENLQTQTSPVRYDPDLLYVECRFCGKPVLWEKGKTALLIQASGIDTSMLDAECLILADGCPNCCPRTDRFQLQVVRLAALSPHDILLLSENRGTA
ncbi:hypothetical protein FACS1894206_03580 [Deltaproteobacteria bacterium]|nr:hypothetical protein FACS1894206_03580 [Deltaproteobacteria bacterium]